MFATATGLWQVPASGGEPRALALADTGRHELYRWPEVLPSGRATVFTRVDSAGFELATVSLETGDVQPLGLEGTNPHFVTPGFLLFARLDGALLAAAFDPNALRITGPVFPVAEGVLVGIAGAAKLGVSRTGTLAYFQESSTDRTLALVDRAGHAHTVPAPPQAFTAAVFSPDGRRIATDISPTGGDLRDIWVLDLAWNTFRRVTFDSGTRSPVWTPDGRRIAFRSKPGGRLYGYAIRWKLADGGDSAETLMTGELHPSPGGFTPDGRALVFQMDLLTGRDIWILPLAGNRNPEPYVRTPFDERGAVVSPDGRWLAYVSNDSGQDEVYVRTFPHPRPAVPVSAGGGREPRWAPNGRELFYRNEHGMVAVAVDPSTSFRVGRRTVLFDDDPYLSSTGRAAYDVHPDGRRFLMIRRGSEGPQVVVVLTWFDQLRAVSVQGVKAPIGPADRRSSEGADFDDGWRFESSRPSASPVFPRPVNIRPPQRVSLELHHVSSPIHRLGILKKEGPMSPSRFIALAVALAGMGCGHIDVLRLDPTPRPPTQAAQVRFLAQEPEEPYTVIALVAVTEGDMTPDARTRLSKVAAELGGDAVLLGPESLRRISYGEGGSSVQLSGKVIVFKRDPPTKTP